MKPNILIIRFSSLGDVILTSPVITNIKINIPDSSITFLTKEKFKPTVELIEGIDRIITIPEKISLPAFLKKLFELDKSNFDYVIDLHGNIRSWWVRKIISSQYTEIYPKRRVERLLAVKKKIIPEIYPHTIDLYNAVLNKLGMKTPAFRPLLAPNNKIKLKRYTEFKKDNDKYIAIAPGAAHPAKQWSLEKFAETAEKLHHSENYGIVWATTSADANTEIIESKIPKPSLMVTINEPIDSLANIINNAILTIANDSGIAHLSSAVGTPVLSLFGPTHPVLGFSPRGLNDKIIQNDEYCRPCSLHGQKKCFREERFCFTKISSDDVVNLAAQLISSNINSEKAAFIDRDGTIIVDKHFLSNPDEIEFESKALEGLKKIKQAGYKLVIISNQSGVARGYFTPEQVDIINARLVEMLAANQILIDAVYFCPHHPDGSNPHYNMVCHCRKPAPGMAEEAAYQLGVDLRKSIVIGDKLDDVNLAKTIGAKAILVKSGYGSKHVDAINNSSFYNDLKIADNLEVAADMI